MKYKVNIITLALLILVGSYSVQSLLGQDDTTSQTIYRAGTQGSFQDPSNLFVGDVKVDLLFPANEKAHFSGAYVTFQPSARSAWHIHPAGQHIIVTSGVGRTGEWGGPVTEIKTGDVVWCPPGVKHWHGASPDSEMTHLVITGSLDGRNVEWREHVTDEQYNGK